MDKSARADHEIHPLLRDRWSPRAFTDAPVAPDALRSLLEAARWAASSRNEQPWRFVVARREDGEDGEAFERVLSTLVEANRSWAKHAAVLGLVAIKSTFAHNDKPNHHAGHDAGQALAQLTVQATSMGLSVHQMAGFDVDAARERLGVPDGFVPHVAFAVGVAGDVERLPEKLQKGERAERQRKPLDEIVFEGAWGSPLESD